MNNPDSDKMEKKTTAYKLMHGELKIDGLFKLIWQYRKLYIKNLGIAFILAVVYALSLPRYYEAKVLLVPEYSNGASSFGGLGSLASLAGINLAGGGGEDAIVPTLYPDLISSTDFLVSLFDVRIVTKDTSYVGTLRDYMATEQKVPWWTAAKEGVVGLFSSDSVSVQQSAPDAFRLTKEEMDMTKMIGQKLECAVDKKTNVITLAVTDQDPLVSALLVDTLRNRLQNFIIAYRTQKATNDLKHMIQMRDSAELNYKIKQKKYADFADANKALFLQTGMSQLDELKNDAQSAYTVYNQLIQQVELSRAKVLERTPAFTVVQNATVPILPAGPKRSFIVLAFLMLGFIGTTAYVILKK